MFQPPSLDMHLLHRLLDYWGVAAMMVAAGYAGTLTFETQTVLMINTLLLVGVGQGLSHSLRKNLTICF